MAFGRKKHWISVCLLLATQTGFAAVDVETAVHRELAKLYPNARVEVSGGIRWVRGALAEEARSVTVLAEDGRGDVQILVKGDQQSAEGWASYSAWVPARVALKRIQPGEKLRVENFITQEVNAATGQAFVYRGMILPRETEVGSLEARQTILEGQFLVSSAVQKVPDVRRGDAVRIQLRSGDLNLTTTGTAEEPGYLDGRIRVLTGQTKRELIGKLQQGGVVEVNL